MNNIEELKKQIKEKKDNRTILIAFLTMGLFFFLLFYLDDHSLLRGQESRKWEQESKESTHALLQYEFKFRNEMVEAKNSYMTSLASDSTYEHLFRPENRSILNEYIYAKLSQRFENKLDSIEVDWSSSKVWKLNFVEIEIAADLPKDPDFEKIISDETLLYGDIVDLRYRRNESLNIPIVLGILLIYAVLLSITLLTSRKSLRHKQSALAGLLKSLQDENIELKESLEVLEQENPAPEQIEKIKNVITEILENSERYKLENTINTSLLEETVKSGSIADDIYGKSHLMLLIGLFISVIGATFFYFTLPVINFDEVDKGSRELLVLILRPALILIFIQSIAIYLIRQYRKLLEDYKYFNRRYSINHNRLAAYQITSQEDLDDDLKLKLIALLKEVDLGSDLSSQTSEEEKQDLIDLLKMAIGKL